MELPLVFLPGMMCDARLFGPQITRFSSQRVIIVAPVVGAESVERIASQILKVMPVKFVLIGLSFGGIVAMEIIRQAPDRVSKLALLDTNHSAELVSVRDKREQQIEKVKQGKLSMVIREEMKPNYLAQKTEATEILDLCMTMATNLGPQVFIDQSRALASRRDQTETLLSIFVPTLILCGESDRLCPVKKHKEMAELVRGCTLAIVQDSGHLPTLENEEETNRILQKWLQ